MVLTIGRVKGEVGRVENRVMDKEDKMENTSPPSPALIYCKGNTVKKHYMR